MRADGNLGRYIGAAVAAGGANEALFQVGQPHVIGPRECLDARPPTRIGLAATMASPVLCLIQIRVDSDTPSFAAITCVAPGVRFSDLAIFVTPALAFAMALICRTSSLVHSRRMIFLVLAIVAPVLWDRRCTMRLRVGNRAGTSL